jgi:hypothetical protein
VQILVIIGIAVVILVVCILALAASKPDAFRIERSQRMKASPEKIYAVINDFHRWSEWSPWEKLDPQLKRTYGGSASGQGAVYEWQGNKQVGQGRMEIREALPPSKVTIQLDFLKPFEAHNTAEFALEKQGEFTNVTWAMQGRQPFMFKAMGLFFSMDKMVGKDFEKGLDNMKGIVEK